MPSDEAEQFRDVFSLFDKYGDGTVECCEIGDMLRAVGVNPTQEEVRRAVADIDLSGKNRITFEEFLPLLFNEMKKIPGTHKLESFTEGFRVFDRENNGMVSVAEVRHLLTNLGERLTSEDVDILVSGMEDSRGMINYEDFVRSVMFSAT